MFESIAHTFIDEPSLRYNAQLYKGGTIVPMSRQEGTAEL